MEDSLFARFHPVTPCRKRGDGHAAMAATERFARSLMRGRTPQSRVHPSGAETVKTLGRGELQSAPSLLPPTPLLARYENCTLAIFILATEQQQAANKYGTHKSARLPQKPKPKFIRYNMYMSRKVMGRTTCYTCHK